MLDFLEKVITLRRNILFTSIWIRYFCDYCTASWIDFKYRFKYSHVDLIINFFLNQNNLFCSLSPSISFLRPERMFDNFRHSFFLTQLICLVEHNRDKKQNRISVLYCQNCWLRLQALSSQAIIVLNSPLLLMLKLIKNNHNQNRMYK